MRPPAKKIRMPKVVYENEPLAGKGWAITLGIFAVIAVLIIYFYPINRVISDGEYYFQGNRSLDQISLSYELIENQDIEPFDTIIFGTSSVRAAYENSSDLNADYLEGYGRKIAFANLSTSGQTVMEMLVFVNKLNLSEQQTVIFSLSAKTFATSPEFSINSFRDAFHPLNYFYSLRDQLDTVPELASYIDEQYSKKNRLKTFRRQLHININLGLRDWVQENIYGTHSSLFRFYYDGLPLGDDQIINRTQAGKSEALEFGFDRYQDYNMRLFRLILEKVAASGARIHFIEQPQFAGDNTFEPWQDKYFQLIDELKADYPLSYTDFNDQADLYRGEFFDITHVSKVGRAKWSKAFLQWVNSVKEAGRAADVR